MGFSAFVEAVTVDSKRTTRVMVGPELLRSNAIRAQERLKKEAGADGIVVRYPRS
jgi:cell division septation protein DedD